MNEPQWENLHDNKITSLTRAKVLGGWIVENERGSIAFLPDPQHQWQLTEPTPEPASKVEAPAELTEQIAKVIAGELNWHFLACRELAREKALEIQRLIAASQPVKVIWRKLEVSIEPLQEWDIWSAYDPNISTNVGFMQYVSKTFWGKPAGTNINNGAHWRPTAAPAAKVIARAQLMKWYNEFKNAKTGRFFFTEYAFQQEGYTVVEEEVQK